MWIEWGCSGKRDRWSRSASSLSVGEAENEHQDVKQPQEHLNDLLELHFLTFL